MKIFLVWSYQLIKYQDQSFTSPNIKESVLLTSSSDTWWCHKLSCSKLINHFFFFFLFQQKTKLSFFGNLLRTTEITWSIFSLLILKEYKEIIHSQTSYGSFKISAFYPSLLFSRIKFFLCYPNSLTPFFKKLNLISFTISIAWFILSIFLLTL